MNKRIISSNIKKTLFFSSSIILSTSFFATYLIVKNECQSLEYHLKETSQKEELYNNTIKSLNRKKNQLIGSIDDLVAEKYNFVTPDPESIIVFTGSINE